jgi:hypothetical protein
MEGSMTDVWCVYFESELMGVFTTQAKAVIRKACDRTNEIAAEEGY